MLLNELAKFWYLFNFIAIIVAVKAYRNDTDFVGGAILATLGMSMVGIVVYYGNPTVAFVAMTMCGIAFVLYDGHKQGADIRDPSSVIIARANIGINFSVGGVILIAIGVIIRYQLVLTLQ